MKQSREKINSYFESEGADGHKFVHMIESDENEYEITAKLIIPKNSKMIEKMIKNNKSPIRQMLEELEKQRNIDMREGKIERSLYELEN